MKDWNSIEPDVYTLVGPHRFTRGRSRPIDRIVIHHNAGVRNTAEYIRDLWNNEREASAHYQVEANGRIGQLVHDRDTAWHAKNADINARSIGIEHANISGPPRWQISDATIEEGAHLVAALCRYYKLGRPEWGRNVFPHSAYAQTSCPYQLAPGGEDHEHYMARAKYWYDNPGNPAPVKEEPKMTAIDSSKVDRIHHELTHEFQSRYRDPQGKQSTYRDTAIGYALQNDEKLTRITDQILPEIRSLLQDVAADVRALKQTGSAPTNAEK